MIFYLIIFLILVAILVGFCIWIYRLIKLYKNGNKKSFWIQSTILATIIVIITWNLRIFPFSKNIYIKEQTELLTGKSFWSWELYDYEEISVRGEGYTIDIFEFDEKIAEYFKNPDSVFFEKYPIELDYRKNWTRNTWKKTPVIESEIEYLEHSTPHYGNWKGEIVERMEFVRELAKKEGSFYAFNNRGENNVDFFILCPKEKLIIMINHNM
jgi:hypothetical protein